MVEGKRFQRSRKETFGRIVANTAFGGGLALSTIGVIAFGQGFLQMSEHTHDFLTAIVGVSDSHQVFGQIHEFLPKFNEDMNHIFYGGIGAMIGSGISGGGLVGILAQEKMQDKNLTISALQQTSQI